MRLKKAALEETFDVIEKVRSGRLIFANLSPKTASAKLDEETVALETEVTQLQQKSASLSARAELSAHELSAFQTSCDNALAVLLPQSWWKSLFGFLASVRAQRWDRCRSIMRWANYSNGPFASLQIPASSQVRDLLDTELQQRRAQTQELEHWVRQALAKVEEAKRSGQDRIAAKRLQIESGLTRKGSGSALPKILFSKLSR